MSDPSEKARKHKKNSDIAIYATGIFTGLLFMAMTLYMVTYAKNNKIEMFDNSYNQYSYRLAKEYLRGSIYSADGQLLAYSEGEDAASQTRVYPYANLYAHAVGYSTHGKMGVESLANYYLMNYHSGIRNQAQAEASDTALKADSIYTTLDSRLQQVAFDSLGVYKGAVIITDVRTGRILAMVSKPDFDPNNIDVLWDELLSDKANSNLLNRVTQGLYPPGSTFKIITALEYLRENNNSYDGYRFNCNGKYTLEDTTIKCFHGTVHGSIDFETAFAKSCNSAFADIGSGLDPVKFASTLSQLGFDKEPAYEGPVSVSTTAIGEEVDMHNLLQASIGQGQDSMSPLHLNIITAAIAGGGSYMKPHLLDYCISESGSRVYTFPESSGGKLMSPEESEILTELMKQVVENGTGTRLKNELYTAAGKTGSAEFNNYSKDDSHAWFTGFAPAEDPEIAVTIIIEGAGSGGEYAVPVAKRMFDEYFESDILSE